MIIINDKITFNIPYPPTKKGKSAFCRRFGLNAYYSGKHWAQRKKDADELHALTLVALKQARVRRGMVRGPVSITFAWDDGLDIDNHAAIAKAVAPTPPCSTVNSCGRRLRM